MSGVKDARGVNLIGRRFGHLKVLSKNAKRNDQGRVLWKCLCDCGKSKVLTTPVLTYGRTTSCRQCNEVETGQRFFSLTVTGKSRLRSATGRRLWNCTCDCGTAIRVADNNLKSGNTKSCGCNKLDAINESRKQKMLDNYGVHLSSKDIWYTRSAAAFMRIKREKAKTDFNSIVELAMYLKSIAPRKCPVFGRVLSAGDGSPHAWSPSVDRIVPSKGYVRGNIQVISNKANTMKQNATPTQLKQFAQWALKEMA